MRLFLRLLALLVVITFLTACNTIRGVGQDLSAVGNTLSRTAD